MYLNWRKIKDCTPTKDRYKRRLNWKGRVSDELVQTEEKNITMNMTQERSHCCRMQLPQTRAVILQPFTCNDDVRL